MARVKPKRQGIHMDMTAMSDMAWLLLTFFILTTQFKKPDIVSVKTPSSVAETKLQDGDLMRVTINNDGKYYFSIIDDRNKIAVLDKMASKHGLSFSDSEKRVFMGLSEVPVPIRALNSYLNLSDSQREKTIPGIPLDSVDLQLVDWITSTIEVDPKVQLAIKGDVKAQYPKFKELIKQLQERDINKFQLITSSEVKPQ
ncbi:ExbD/TolR family protein [Moheibacter sediminis]|uniref:Biopolymer transport protein ExbD/TolR n=1 Tax=Moheibacter sediminis TaxID=1434700 RepID=A0A1W1ZC59_9FLAO|nr:biopolymer transporter ExbD [Moheibacter sediminis]SMC45628.1 Biopolymer transport protein ExbD/TolR [Moheibacter sediminis]